jgi:cytochrome P450/NADPH-cytochrome P450 reductase
MKLSNVYVTAHDIKKRVMPSVRYPIVKNQTTTTPRPVAEVDIKAKIESHNGKLDIYYGSNTGTCEDLAHRLYNDSKQFGFDTTLNSLDVAASKGFEKDGFALIVASTYNGQPPDNAKKFAEYCKVLEPNSLSGVNVAIIGIGNSNWKSFQAFPLYIENALSSAGAKIVCRRGVADEEKDIKGDTHSWVDLEFWPSAFKFVGLDPKTSGKSVKIDRYGDDALDLVVTDSNELSCHLLRSLDNKFATVLSSRELQSPNSGRSTRHIEFKLPKNVDYCVGDHLAIFPENDPELIIRFGSLINEHDLGRVVTVTAASNDHKVFRHLPFGIPIKVSELLGRHVDLQAPITASFLNAAVASAVDPEQLDILNGISDLIRNGVNGDWQQLRPVQILTAFPSVHMTLEKVLPTIAPMKKRYYSISSSPLAFETETQIASVTVGVVEGKSPKDPMILAAETSPEEFRGVSSGYLADLRPGQLAEVSVVKNERFRLPKNSLAPVIMIGPGTGVAPFRGFIQELNVEAEQRRQAMLFFGCRNEKDYLYRSELESASIELHVAFSRPDTGDGSSQNNSKTPQYVQDLLWENRDRVWQLLLEEGAHIYVCGDGRHMAKDVDATLCRIAVESGNMNENDAIAYFEQLQKNGGYLQDVWCN